MKTALLRRIIGLSLTCCGLLAVPLLALDRPGREFKIYQFPAAAIPRIDGNDDDWSMVPESYEIGTSELWDSTGKIEGIQPESLDVRVRVGWVKGMNRLYFLYEAYDDYWDFSRPGLRNDTFEVVVDGDLSGGPFVDKFRINEDILSREEAYFTIHSVHAQNYHIFTPAREKSWAMFWGIQQWLKSLPYSNVVYRYDFEPGESGRLTMEFYITAYDHASPKGAAYSTQSTFEENKVIGLCWAIIDYDDATSERSSGFWNLSSSHTMFGKADELVAFRLMPLEDEHVPAIEAAWDFSVIDRQRRVVAFHDKSIGEVDGWHWDFGDETTSTEQHPVHTYAEGGKYVVVLTVEGPQGTSRFSRVWDVSLP
ncbi:MAG: PKD domain-containing protein [Puniceicoccaceae bacterium]